MKQRSGCHNPEVKLKNYYCKKVRPFALSAGLVFLCCLAFSGMATAADDVDVLKQQLNEMMQQMGTLQKKITDLETQNAEKKSEIKEIDERLNKAELHTATDKVSFGVNLRTRAETMNYENIRMAPSSFTASFFTNYPSGFNGATLAQAQAMIAGMVAAGSIPAPEKVDATNDVIYTNKFHLNMNAKVNSNLSFTGRMAAYKVFGDSSGVKFNQGSLADVTFDGNTSSLPHGDTMRLERAYFNYRTDIGDVPINFSLGRRPSTSGPPLEYAEYSLEGGSPLATIINWQFDGASLSFDLEDKTNIPGFAVKLCYGVGFEGDWGNSYALNDNAPSAKDVHMAGIITTLFDNDTTSAVLNYAHAWDITDGFTGLTVMPFIVTKTSGQYNFAKNTGGYISRLEPYTNIGDWDAASLLVRTNLSESVGDIDLFFSTSWSHTDPSTISNNPFYEILGQGLLSSNGDLKSRDGYMVYLGAVLPMPFDARLGLEYNWGSKYWFNFTGAEDSLVGSKLAVRGSVYEAYYLQPILNDNFFLTLGVRYYDYEYTGSGNPLGEPVKISDTTSLDTLNAVVDEVLNGYISLTFRY